ncbi:(d)CMP kinase [Eubacteriales bacterium OttesenSCG-928-N13]|nr:(d)CMP kinase [Eubacteriales bacterium OttesenSCG-928-N13]
MQQTFSIAIDGPSAAGKSTIAKAIAQQTGALYLDTGAMYRAMGLYMLRNDVDPRDVDAVLLRLDEPRITVAHVDGVQRIFLFDEDVSDAIRSHPVSAAASAVSAVPQVRVKLVQMQREIAAGLNVVMDGRDIGTHVLPNATLKIMLVASPEVRARRRFDELQSRGTPEAYEKVLADMTQRDHDDSTRAASPLKRADDAIELDSGDMTVDQVVQQVLALLSQRLGGAAR